MGRFLKIIAFVLGVYLLVGSFHVRFFTQVVDFLLHSDMRYCREYVKGESWILTKDSMLKAVSGDFEGLRDERVLTTKNQEAAQTRYQVFIIQNRGSKIAWGIVGEFGGPNPLSVPYLPPYMEKPYVYVSEVNLWNQNPEEIQWRFLYTKPVKKLTHVK